MASFLNTLSEFVYKVAFWIPVMEGGKSRSFRCDCRGFRLIIVGFIEDGILSLLCHQRVITEISDTYSQTNCVVSKLEIVPMNSF